MYTWPFALGLLHPPYRGRLTVVSVGAAFYYTRLLKKRNWDPLLVFGSICAFAI